MTSTLLDVSVSKYVTKSSFRGVSNFEPLTQIHTGEQPFAEVPDRRIIAHVLRGNRLRVPQELRAGCPDFWDIVERCWVDEPRLRPDTRSLAEYLPLRESIFNVHEWDFPDCTWPSRLATSDITGPMNLCFLNLLLVDPLDTRSVLRFLSSLVNTQCPTEVMQYIINRLVSAFSV